MPALTLLRDWLARVPALPADTARAVVARFDRRPTLGEAALTVLLGEIHDKVGEQVRNNDGERLRHYARRTRLPWRPGMAWCALFVSYGFRVAADDHGLRLPFELSLSARALYRNIGRAGSFVTDLSQLRHGDVPCWRRGKEGWQGHIGLLGRVEGGLCHVAEGNVGSFPAMARLFPHDVTRERLLGIARAPG